VAVEFNVKEIWTLTGRYSAYFGPVPNGVGGPLADRDSLSFTVKRTF